MALTTNTVWEIRTTGSDSNGGGYVTGAAGTDYSQQASAQYSSTDLESNNATSSTPQVSAVSHSFVTADEGNIIYISAGTNWTAGRYQIVSTSGGVATLDRACGSAAAVTGGTYAVGGALLTMDTAYANAVPGNICYIKDGTYTRTSTLTIAYANTRSLWFIGYNTNRTFLNNDTTRPLITTATDSTVLFTGSNNTYGIGFRNINFTNTASVRAACFANVTAGSGPWILINCKLSGFTYVGNFPNSAGRLDLWFINVEMVNMTNDAIKNTTAGTRTILYNCYVHHCSGSGLDWQTGYPVLINCIVAYNNAYGANIGTQTVAGGPFCFINTTFAHNVSGDFNNATTSTGMYPSLAINSIFYSANTNFALATAVTDRSIAAYNNAFGGGGVKTNFTTGNNDIALSASPFLNAAAGNYALNNITSGGNLLSATGYPSIFPGTTTYNFIDVGAAQLSATTGGATVEPAYSFLK
jgi:hypothetical protein